MRLAILNQFYVPDISPTAHLAASLAQHRAGSGDVVTVVASQGGYVPEAVVSLRSESGNPGLYRLWTPRFGKATALGRLADYLVFLASASLRLLMLPAQDVIVSLTTPPYVVLAALLHKLRNPRAKVVLWSMDCYPEVAERLGALSSGSLASLLLRCVCRLLYRFVDHFVCLDGAMRELVASQYARHRDGDFSVIPNWEDSTLYSRGRASERWSGVDRYGLTGRLVVLYLGNAGVGHDFVTLLDVAERLRHDPVTFLFVGGGCQYGWLEQQRRRRGLANLVLAPYIPKQETPQALASADCALIALDDRALGVISPSKLHASLAMGVPILYYGPSGSNVHEAIDRFQCGASLRHGDVDGGVRFLGRLRGEPAATRELKRAARSAFETAYCDLANLPRFDALLEHLKSVRQAR